jgi:glycosyltransferase involved in cell wall biosynthesis
MSATEIVPGQPQVSIVIPARNEEASLGSCLESLVAQTGVSFEIIVVDDHSTDRTREIAQSFSIVRSAVRSAVRVIEAGPLPAGWTGKNNAVATGAREARGGWLLFTDADTVHLPGSLAEAWSEARENQADLLSYSPEQIAVTFWEMAVLPVVFAELAKQYPPSKVSDPNSPEAAANGQYILITREAYDAVGGHAAIASEILEDVALARAVKASGRKIRFRYAPTRVRTRMYRNFRQLREGWTKNLALLFPNPSWLAVKTTLWWGLAWGILFGPLSMLLGVVLTDGVASLDRLNNMFLALSGVVKHWWWGLLLIPTFGRNLAQLRRANFDLAMEWLGALFGMPMFAYLLLRSKRMHSKGSVSWKGRTYGAQDSREDKLTNPLHKIAGRLS